jgi:hypothetical protein
MADELRNFTTPPAVFTDVFTKLFYSKASCRIIICSCIGIVTKHIAIVPRSI